MSKTINQIKEQVIAELNEIWYQAENAKQMQEIVNSVLAPVFKEVKNTDHNQLYHQLSLDLHSKTMPEIWKNHLIRSDIDINLPFQQLDRYLAPNRFKQAIYTLDDWNLSIKIILGISLKISRRYPNPLKYLAYLIQQVAAFVTLLTHAITSLVLFTVNKLKSTIIDGLINLMTGNGLNREIQSFQKNHDKYNRYRDNILMWWKSNETEDKKNMTLDEYFNTLPEVDKETINKSVLQEIILNQIKYNGFNYITHTARAVGNSLTQPLPESWFLKLLEVPFRILKLALGVAVAIPLALANFFISKTLKVATILIRGALALTYCSVALAVDSPLLIKDGLNKLCCKKPEQPEINRNAMFQPAQSETSRFESHTPKLQTSPT